MERVRAIEKKLGSLYKDLPVLPKNTKKTIVEYWPYVILVIGVLQLWAAWALWDLIDKYNAVSNFTNAFSEYYAGISVGLSSFEKTVIYVGVAVLLVQAVLLLMAFTPLKNRLRKGWELVFIVSLLQVAYAVLSVFVFGNGVGSLVMNLLGAAIGFYFLFQIREFYGRQAVAADSKVKSA